MKIFIGGAWPYANGSLHVGHIASLLPGDIIARYYRLKGEDVLYVSGSDCNGTPIGIRARQEGITVKEVADRYHQEFHDSFLALGFSFDEYGRTDGEFHHAVVQHILQELYQQGWLYEKEVEQTYCERDSRFLPDRLVEGICPGCGARARGDQCDQCSKVLEPAELLEKTCKLCGQEPVLKTTTHLYFALSRLQDRLETYLQEQSNTWRENAQQLTKRYLSEGLQDRAVTRDLDHGVEVPIEGFGNKKVYVWLEAVCGYLSGSKKWAEQQRKDWRGYWDENATSYYVHGKDNIPFHTLIWPAVLIGINQKKLPDHIISSEYMTLEKRKISTSANWAVWVKDLLSSYQPDSVRYFLTMNAPEKRDGDFSWREFIYSHNSELLGALGNLVQRSLKFYVKEFGPAVTVPQVEEDVMDRLTALYKVTGQLIEDGNSRQGLEEIFSFIRWSNKRFDKKEPWNVIKENREEAKDILKEFLYIICNLRNVLTPFLPFTANALTTQLNISEKPAWSEIALPLKVNIEHTGPLFKRVDVDVIELERAKLNESIIK
ncbi:methionine--tRNA ligase [Bacillus sp. KH172YL63]|uniref:methionine--tRNA ligase n=1 Tax=Bacillus sp. KH172YL63 TaxID=2709784 RepID=UPI0013E4B013|nr:methionine--tRNA ligase [Bacillus sp. KH172YL63]BCB04341.1 methionine--tRNA ligase 2 [Bacillus sp. KH172YL63]